MIRFAFREWAAICRALADGTQSVILRKGGIAEEGGVFAPDHADFWLFPGGFHQKSDELKPEAESIVKSLETRPLSPPSLLRLNYYARVTSILKLEAESVALALDPMHLWTAGTVSKRFHYRKPGLWLLIVRIYRNPEPIDLPIQPEWQACKTWIDTEVEIPLESIRGIPVIDDETHRDRVARIDSLLDPTAIVRLEMS